MTAAIGALLLAIAASFALNFPALTGRVVDQANIIQPATRAAIEGKLAELESKSGIQLVVATVNSLEGQDIEPYANELFRNWKLGEKEKNNGVLLLVAPNERRVRIEVGYGLEKTLTDALSKVIITNAIAPRFKAGDFSGGISRGVDDIITVLTTDASEWEQRPSLRLDKDQQTDPTSWILFFAFLDFHHSDCRIADLPLVVHQRADQCLGQFRPIRRWLFRRWLLRRRRLFGRRRIFRWRRVFGRRWRFGELVMEISKEDQDRITEAIRAAEAKTSGEIVCVLAQTSTHAAASPIFHRRGYRACAALAAHGLYRDDGLPHSVVAGDRLPGAGDVALPATGARCIDAAQGSPCCRLSPRHGAVHQPRPRSQQKSVRDPHFCFSRGALCPHYCRHRDRRAGAPEPMAGSRRRLDRPHAQWPYCRGVHRRDRHVRGGACKAFSSHAQRIATSCRIAFI